MKQTRSVAHRDEQQPRRFVRLGGDAGRIVSGEALQLHIFAILSSIESGDPGFVADEYLDAIHAETSLATAELCVARVWGRVDGGYRIDDAEMLRIATEVHRQLLELAERCRADGGHRPDPGDPRICARCFTTRAPTSHEPQVRIIHRRRRTHPRGDAAASGQLSD